MSATTEQVFIDALSLPTRVRATLVHKLLRSLESEEGSPEIEAAWNDEAAARCNAFDEGKLTERDAADDPDIGRTAYDQKPQTTVTAKASIASR